MIIIEFGALGKVLKGSDCRKGKIRGKIITRTKYIKVTIVKTHPNSKCRLCDERHETINLIISESRKLAQKVYKTRHEWVRKVIHWELWNSFRFGHTEKWCMHVLENETHKVLWNFEIQTDYLITTRRTDQVIVNNNNKKRQNLRNSRLCYPSGPQSENKRKLKER